MRTALHYHVRLFCFASCLHFPDMLRSEDMENAIPWLSDPGLLLVLGRGALGLGGVLGLEGLLGKGSEGAEGEL